MNNIFNNQSLIIALLSGLFAGLASAIAYILFKSIKGTKYDEVNHRIQMEQMRSSLEKEFYKINERLMTNEERWKDVNHLFLRRELEDENISRYEANRSVRLNKFLRSNGIVEKDLTVEKDFVFVLTPFNDIFLEDFVKIKNICTNVGLRCQRGDETFYQGDIFNHVLKSIIKANLVIANINGRNANVLYELGIAQALDKPTVFIARTLEDIPVDIKSKRFIIYKTDEELERLLKAELLKIFVESNREIYIKIIKATYGSSKNSFDATKELNDMINNNRLEFILSNQIVGDPDPGALKTMEIEYEINGEKRTRKYKEGARVVIVA